MCLLKADMSSAFPDFATADLEPFWDVALGDSGRAAALQVA